jgi:glycerol-3-phosphate dehydrogenase
MAQEVVDFALKLWRRDAHQGKVPPLSTEVGPSRTLNPVNPNATASAMEASRHQSASQGIQVPEELFSRYGAEAIDIVGIQSRSENASFNVSTPPKDPDGFPFLAAQLRHNLRTGMVMHLADFYFRRIPLFACRSDHGLPWAQVLAQIWAEERGFGQAEAEAEVTRLYAEVERNTAWTKVIPQAKAKADPGSEVFG